jgi:phosphoenolpyruvate-protein kinase (PTS system EI component)
VPSVLPQLKALLRKLTLEECDRIARQALEQRSAEAVRALGVRVAARDSEPQSVQS